MKLCPRYCKFISTMLVLATSTMSGCALWTPSSETIIRVQTQINPNKAKRLTIAGVKALNTQNIDGATAKFLAAIEADETYGPAHNNLGLLHFEQGNLYQAVLAFEHAMEFMPADPAVVYNLGLTLEAAGKVDQAKDLYYQAVQMDPVNPVFLGNLVRLKYRLGETGPELRQKLEDLLLIETRSQWRRWADGLLAIEFNDALDRGPETPDFDPSSDRESKTTELEIEDRIIELTPSTPARFESSEDMREIYGDRLGAPMQSILPESSAPPAESSRRKSSRRQSSRPVPELSAPELSAPELSAPLMVTPQPETTVTPAPIRSSPPETRSPPQNIRDSAPIELSAPGMETGEDLPLPGTTPTSPDDSMSEDVEDLFDF